LATVPIPAPEAVESFVYRREIDQDRRIICGGVVSSAALGSSLNAPMPVRRGARVGSAAVLAMGDAFVCVLLIVFSGQFTHGSQGALPAIANFAPLPITIGLFALLGSYRSLAVKWSREYMTLLAGTALGFTAGEMVAELAGTRGATAPFALAWSLTLLALLQVRLLRRFVAGRNLKEGKLPVVILGTTTCARSVYRALEKAGRSERDGDFGLRVAAIFADGAENWPEATQQDVVMGGMHWAKSFAECCQIKYAIVAIPAECDAATEKLFAESAQIFRYLFVVPQIARDETTVAARRGRELTLHVGANLEQRETGHLKRLLDLLGAMCFGALSVPFILVTALAIRLSSNGPVLFKQVRIGKGNRAFTTLKFRTMYGNAGERLNEYLRTDPQLQAEWTSVHKLKDDPRVTPIGRFLRRFSLDELPQLWNVLVGEMSLVGPRPIVVREIEKYGREYAAYERARPGLTGLWQVSGRNNTTYQQRVDYDSFYVRNWSMRLDATIIGRTVRAVISGEGAY
jgi:Undecaprenyl-phosphate galactose phosphotransferase WbaP